MTNVLGWLGDLKTKTLHHQKQCAVDTPPYQLLIGPSLQNALVCHFNPWWQLWESPCQCPRRCYSNQRWWWWWLTRSASTRKEERSTSTQVGTMKKTALKPRMLSSRRWWMRVSLSTWLHKTFRLKSIHQYLILKLCTAKMHVLCVVLSIHFIYITCILCTHFSLFFFLVFYIYNFIFCLPSPWAEQL